MMQFGPLQNSMNHSNVRPLVRIERVDSLFELAIENAINEARSILKLHE
ncbi:MAG: hypothetical protein IT288_00100 [Bdellovibrionales bacterium]|nr:hypothetical protein [Bdellovibrionales bacterium]